MAIGGITGGAGAGVANAIRAGAAYVELFLQDKKLVDGLDGWRGKLGRAGRTLFTAGAATLGAGTAIAAPLVGLAAKTAESRVEMGRLAAKIGENVTTLSRFAYAAETTGLSLEDLEGGWENLSERIVQATQGAGEAGQAFQQLGINAQSMLGMSRVEQMLTLADAFEKISDPTKRNAIQSGLGGDQFQKFNALFAAGRSQVEKLMREADDVGATQTEEQTRAATAASLAWMRVKTAGASVFKAIGDAILGPSATIEDLADRTVNVIKAVRLFVQENQDLIRGAFLVGVTLMGVGATLVTLGAGLSAAGTALGGLKAVIVGVPVVAKFLFAVLSGGFALLMTPVGVFTLAVVALGVAFFTLTDLGRAQLAALAAHFAETAENAKLAWGGIVDAVKAGDIRLAWAITTAFLDLEWKRLWAEARRVASETWDFFKGGWDSAVYAVKSMWIDLKEFVVTTAATMAAESIKAMGTVFARGADWLAGLVEKLNPDWAAKLRLAGAGGAVTAGAADDWKKGAQDDAKAAAQAERNLAQAQFQFVTAVREAVARMIGGLDAKAVADAQQKLNDRVAQAARALADKERRGGFRDNPADGIVNGVRGTFSAFAVGQQFGSSDLARQQVRETIRVREAIETMTDIIVREKGLVFA